MGVEKEALKKHLSDAEWNDLKRCLEGNLDLYMDCEKLFVNLCDYYADEMPYGTAKARTGDPDVWILERIGQFM